MKLFRNSQGKFTPQRNVKLPYQQEKRQKDSESYLI
jgi:hypothetical protein